MPEVSTLRLHALRAMYLVLIVGLAIFVWPGIVGPLPKTFGQNTVVMAMLGGISLLALLGLRYPLQMLPLLMFELLWKMVWALGFALPAWLSGGLNEYAQITLVECMVGLVLVPLALPWGYIVDKYVRAKATPWHAAA